MSQAMLMAKFKTNLKALMLNKSAVIGEPLTQKEIAEATGLSIPAVARWYHNDVDRLEPNSVSALMKYFGCKFEELVEVVDD